MTNTTHIPATPIPATQIAVTENALPVAGVRLATASAGVRKAGKVDLCAIEIAEGARSAGVFTRNVFCAAPVTICREHLARTAPRLLVINSGNANAGTGEQGFVDAHAVCEAGARLLGCPAEAVLPFSTGVIGQRLPSEKIIAALPTALSGLSPAGWPAAAAAIMTTDTFPKCYSAQVVLAGVTYTVTGIAKGAGMIKPDMATMLAFVATDMPLSASGVTAMVREVADRSFNRITIDGDTSTNDSCMLIATGALKEGAIQPGDARWTQACDAVEVVFKALARAIVRDGEGATKLVSVQVSGGESTAECLKAAYAVAESPLVKTALFASDPNWGRILAAVGRSGVAGLRMENIGIALDDYPIIQRGEPVPGYDEAVSARIMAGKEFAIKVTLGDAPHAVEVLTCDFSYDYVRINAEYRS
ncbi:MAG: bifunctional glutamate N-acetyltransferase/amino-acid acetyltransferase ArgJ [Gammaproteobacteria bacterium]|nr:bifunctional glutamate N-acetyltransferase/amino-acid acetyltransferase ArgJ [Gammaproteobacteria bacterium]